MKKKEAIQILETQYQHDSVIREALKTLIPELRESEDERIRKELLDAVDKARVFDIDKYVADRWTAWLEKQKEGHNGKKWIYEDEYQKDLERLYNDGKDEVLNHPKKYGLQKEQKPYGQRDECKDCQANYAGSCKGTCEMRQKEQNPTEKVAFTPVDTELTEFEKAVVKLCQIGKDEYPCYEFAKKYAPFLLDIAKKELVKPAEWSEEIIRKAVKEVGLTQHQIDWFKTNVFPPKQEWSKEDEKMLKNILWVLESYISKGESAASPSLIVSYPTYYKEIDWLKSLRPSWKPSELEKDALRTAIHLMTEERNFPKAAEQLQNILNVFEGKESRHDWKPSKEEMKALDVACSGKLWYGEIYLEGLKRIREQLKKL